MPTDDLYTMAQYMSAEDIAAEIRMQRQAETGAFLLLEGSSDYKRFKKFLNEESTSVVICWGKGRLIEVINGLDGFDSIDCLGFADADFDRVLGATIERDNLIYSDLHDFDLDWATSAAFDRYLFEAGDEKKCSECGDWRLEIMQAIEPLSKMKFANVVGRIDCSFKRLDWRDCFDGTTFNREKAAYKILKKQNPTREIIEKFCEAAAPTEEFDLYQLTNGHDFLFALGCCLGSRIGKRRPQQIEREEVELHLRLAFGSEDFERLSSYHAILKWQENTGLSVLN